MRKIPSNPLFWSLAVLLFPLLMEVTFSDFVREGEYNSRIGWSFIAALFITLANQRWVTALVLLPFMIGGLADIGYAYTFSPPRPLKPLFIPTAAKPVSSSALMHHHS